MFGVTCREVSELASDCLDGELPPGRRALLRLHLAVCSACAAFVQQIRLVKEALPMTRHHLELSESTRAALLDAFEQQHGAGD